MESLKPFSFWRYGKEYFESYLILYEHYPEPMKLLGVKFFLLGHTIEALLKSYLLSKGLTESELKTKKYGHDLIKLFDKAAKSGINKVVAYTEEEIQLVALMNKYFINKEFQYPKLGSKQFPHFEYIEAMAGKLVLGLHFMRFPRKPLRLLDEVYPPEPLPVESWF